MSFPSRATAHFGAGFLALLLAGCASTQMAPPAPVTINLVSLNDFHGNLEPSRYTMPGPDGKPQTVKAGGAEAVASALQAWRQQDKDLLVLSVGDNVGASPALSSLWADEPTIEALNLMGVRASAVGNHEFDAGRKELLRQQNGGCESPRQGKACQFAPQFNGAKFTYLAANVIDRATGKPFIPGYTIETVKGIKVGVVGVVLKGTAGVALASGIAGLSFEDEAESINRMLPEMRAAGAQVIVALVHEGGRTEESPFAPSCSKLKGAIVDVVKKIDPSVKLVLSGHSHQGYMCNVEGRTVTQAATAGQLLTRIAMTVEPASGKVLDIKTTNEVMLPNTYPADPAMSAFIAKVKEQSRAALTRPIAKIAGAPVTRNRQPSGESALGCLVADAAVASTRHLGVQIGFMNEFGIRRDLEAGSDGVTTFGQVQAVLPFGNTMVVMDLTGAQIRALLEQQWSRPATSPVTYLQISQALSYAWDERRPVGQRVVPESVKVNGKPIDDNATYRVVANNFIAEGGDHFPEFAKGTNRIDTGLPDIDGFIDLLKQREGEGASLAPQAPRIVKVQ